MAVRNESFQKDDRALQEFGTLRVAAFWAVSEHRDPTTNYSTVKQSSSLLLYFLSVLVWGNLVVNQNNISWMTIFYSSVYKADVSLWNWS